MTENNLEQYLNNLYIGVPINNKGIDAVRRLKIGKNLKNYDIVKLIDEALLQGEMDIKDKAISTVCVMQQHNEEYPLSLMLTAAPLESKTKLLREHFVNKLTDLAGNYPNKTTPTEPKSQSCAFAASAVLHNEFKKLEIVTNAINTINNIRDSYNTKSGDLRTAIIDTFIKPYLK